MSVRENNVFKNKTETRSTEIEHHENEFIMLLENERRAEFTRTRRRKNLRQHVMTTQTSEFERLHISVTANHVS